MTTLQQASQSLEPGAFVSLYTLDASVIQGPILRWASCCEEDGSAIKFEGLEYPPLNFKADGFAWDGDTTPRPKITASVADNSPGAFSQGFLDIIVGYRGAQGATLYRQRTLARFLDGHEDGGQGIAYPMDVYIVDRIISLDKSAVQWELIAPMDLPNCKLPSRQALREACPWVYRHWNASTNRFDYDATSMACPYSGSACFDRTGAPAGEAADDCGRRVSDCVLRYGRGKPLPYGGFPGLARGR